MFEWYLLEQIPRVPQPPEYERSLALRNRPERENQQRDLKAHGENLRAEAKARNL